MIAPTRRHRQQVRYSEDLPSPTRLQLLRRAEVLDRDLPSVAGARPWEALDL